MRHLNQGFPEQEEEIKEEQSEREKKIDAAIQTEFGEPRTKVFSFLVSLVLIVFFSSLVLGLIKKGTKVSKKI